MATADSVKEKLANLISRANGTTGRQDTTLTAAVNALIAGYGNVEIAAGTVEADSLSELHYWKKGGSQGGITETAVSDVTISTSGTNGAWTSIQYADSIANNDGVLSLVKPTTVTLSSTNRDVIIGKYVYARSTFYFVPTDSTTKVFASGYGSSISVTKAYRLEAVAADGTVGVVISADPSAYPEDGEQGGYRYVYMGTLGAYVGEFPTLTNPGTAADMASGKQLIDGDGAVVTGSLFELPAGQTLYANNDPALNWRTDGKVETIGIYGVAGSGDGGIVRPGARFAVRVPADQYGDATEADVASGKTFTSSAGLRKVGTGSGGGGGGLVTRVGVTTTNVVETGLTDIQLLVLYKPSVSAAGLVQGVYRKDTGKTNYVYCSSYSTMFATMSVSEDYKGNVSGGTFTWGGTGSAVLTEHTEYNWIAVGTA